MFVISLIYSYSLTNEASLMKRLEQWALVYIYMYTTHKRIGNNTSRPRHGFFFVEYIRWITEYIQKIKEWEKKKLGRTFKRRSNGRGTIDSDVRTHTLSINLTFPSVGVSPFCPWAYFMLR